MRKVIAVASLAAGLLMLAGCGDKKGAGGLTEDDNRELNNAAEMLDASPDSLVANDEATLGNGDEETIDVNEATANGTEDPD
jgi:hypothetical protein